MAIGPIGANPLGPRMPQPPRLDPQTVGPQPQTGGTSGGALEGPAAAANSFSQLLQDAVGNIDKLQKTADSNVNKLASGQPVDMHEVAISVEQANLSFQLGLQVRNKLIEAYQEVMRMQV